jgi:hypothetical protein
MAIHPSQLDNLNLKNRIIRSNPITGEPEWVDASDLGLLIGGKSFDFTGLDTGKDKLLYYDINAGKFKWMEKPGFDFILRKDRKFGNGVTSMQLQSVMYTMVSVDRNGQVLDPASDYTIDTSTSPQTIRFTNYTLNASDIVTAVYYESFNGNVTSINAAFNTITGNPMDNAALNAALRPLHSTLTRVTTTVTWDVSNKPHANANFVAGTSGDLNFHLNLLSPGAGSTGTLVITQLVDGFMTITVPTGSKLVNDGKLNGGGINGGSIVINGLAGADHLLSFTCMGGDKLYWVVGPNYN